MQKNKIIIGINGLAGSGKDTIANYLVQNYNFTKLSFAEPLKKIVSIISGWSYDYLDGSTYEYRILRETIKHPIYNKTGREMLQYIGTELFRNNFHLDIWINIMHQEIIKCENTNIIISDCRFENEINLINQLNGYIICISRNNIMTLNNHISEQKIDIKNTINITNNGSINDLYNLIDNIIKNIL